MTRTCCDLCGEPIKLASAYDVMFIRNFGLTSETRIDICSRCREKLGSSISGWLNMNKPTPLESAIREILFRGTDKHDCLPFEFKEDLK